MAEEYGWVVAIILALCCSIVTFAYGWIAWKSDIKWTVMIVWTLCIIIGGFSQYQLSVAGYQLR